MAYYGKRRTKYRAHENNSFWLSFSDMMSALLLVFILVLFYSMYQYLNSSDELNLTTARLMVQQEQLDQQKTALDQKDADLQASQKLLEDNELKLTEKDRELFLEQARLMLLEKDNEAAKALLEQQQAELDSTRSQLDSQQTLLTEQQQKMTDQQMKLDALVGIRTRIIASLAKALSDANIRAVVDPTTGSITLDSSIMFEFASSELKDSGKAVLDQFIPVYLSVLMDGENSANISEVIIEGHTDTDGTYMSNLKLSQERALAVAAYLLADEYPNISQANKERLRAIVTANGRSFSYPVRNPDGNINMEASRRVEFKFRLQDEQMIESMRGLLEQMN